MWENKKPEGALRNGKFEALSPTEVTESFPRQTSSLARQVGVPDFPLDAKPPVFGELPDSGWTLGFAPVFYVT